MSQNLSVTNADDEFNCPCLATQDTVWVADPANPVNGQTGTIRKGETVWLQCEPFGSGPAWQIARLTTNTVCFVQPHHFDASSA